MTKISSKSIVAASANQKIPVSPDNAISPNTIKIYADAAVDLTTVQAVALGASADDGTLYRITGTGGSPLPTGIDNILIWGASSMAGGFDYGNARASVTALGVYVSCTYDVATNVAKFDYLLWAGHLSQAGTSAPTIDATSYNISGETPTFSYNSGGSYQIIFTGGKLISDNSVAHFSFTYDGENQGFVVVTGGDLNTVNLFCYKSGVLSDDRLNNVYIQIRLVYTLN